MERVMTGAEATLEALRRQGVRYIFGYPGGAVLPIYDVIQGSEAMEHILVRHEQGAAHAADGYARATGEVGVCLATSGPGATNLITGIATAHMDSIPMVAITGQVPRPLIGTDAFQESDVFGISMPVTKHNYLVKEPADLPRVIKEAFHLAHAGRPGPVLIDIPKDVQNARQAYLFDDSPPKIPGFHPRTRGDEGEIRRLVELLHTSRRPLLFTGGGVVKAGGMHELRGLVQRLDLPVTSTLLGLGCVPGDHRNFLGMLGMHGTHAANKAMMAADLIIGIGVRFDDRVTGKTDEFAPHATIAHIDIDPAEIGKIVKTEVGIVGDARTVLRQLLDLLDAGEAPAFDHEAWEPWKQDLARWKREKPLHYRAPEEGEGLKAQQVIDILYHVTRGQAIITTGVGQHQMWAAHFYQFANDRNFLTSGGLGTMGYGLPAAMGAQLGRPGELVICLEGDGGFLMTLQELATIREYNLPVKTVILNNHYLGMVRQWQELFFERRYSAVEMQNPDFARLAEAFDIPGLTIDRVEDVQPALEEAFASDEPYVLDFDVVAEENVYPMVPAGHRLDDIVDEENVERV